MKKNETDAKPYQKNKEIKFILSHRYMVLCKLVLNLSFALVMDQLRAIFPDQTNRI
ncbi:hypothetical protein SAMN02787073_2518 [Chryseobacterium vrystaatense]|uniref:Uncharacterized protein n=1 Tax=Chryseobacterium vrystaatense TaxID=307480 RepID=A0A1M5D960_9FLAO|nr:hypothetical protein SAMN02787073_2518 [Chryseobacterium vrystaatense]